MARILRCCGCSSNSTPSLETSLCCGYSCKKKKKIQRRREELAREKEQHIFRKVKLGLKVWCTEELFRSNYHPENEAVMLDLGEGFLSVHFENAEYAWSPTPVRPQFSNVLYQHSSYPSSQLNPLTHPVIAFHSYKGGVGRTLSLLAFVKAWSAVFDDNSQKGNRLLIVDSDIEAPGLTWLKDDMSDDILSYLDLLTLIQDNRSVDEIVDLACEKLKLSTITVETRERKVEHIFLPTYRYEQQLLDLYATPDSIIRRKEKASYKESFI